MLHYLPRLHEHDKRLYFFMQYFNGHYHTISVLYGTNGSEKCTLFVCIYKTLFHLNYFELCKLIVTSSIPQDFVSLYTYARCILEVASDSGRSFDVIL